MWDITSGSQWCELTPDGACVTDGPGDYGNNERCTVVAATSLYVYSTFFDTEYRWDYLMINGRRYRNPTACQRRGNVCR